MDAWCLMLPQHGLRKYCPFLSISQILLLLLSYLQCALPLDVDCHSPMGVRSGGSVPFYWLHASDGHAHRGRLNNDDAWRTNIELFDGPKDPYYAWLQIDLQRTTVVTGVQTQGDPLNPDWVKLYSIFYSEDCEFFTPIFDTEGFMDRFHGNYDENSTVTNLFHEVIASRCIRIVPLSIEANYSAMRIELLGCDMGICKEAVLQHLEKEEFNVSRRNVSLPVPLMSSLLPEANSAFPTSLTGGYAEFKFPAEQIIFGVVFYISPTSRKRRERIIITHSRNCHVWEPIREKQGYGDPRVFSLLIGGGSRSLWTPFVYPFRAHCIRIIPIRRASRFTRQDDFPRGHFIGCGTGEGIHHMCGVRKPVMKRRRRKRIVGGSPSSAGEWPWLISIRAKTPGENFFWHLCGGALVHPQYVITAAHCINVVYGIITKNMTFDFTLWDTPLILTRLKVRFAEYSLNLAEGTHADIEVEKVIGHNDYNISNYMNDIALLKLKRPIRLSDHVNIVCLPETSHAFQAGSNCQVIGWGFTDTSGKPPMPHHVQVPIVSNSDCQKMYSHLVISPDMLCAAPPEGGRDACNGDSGGPLVCPRDGQWFLVGIVSWNIGCGRQGYPGVYAKVTYFLDWIDDVIDRQL